jgi:hypothetical protein
VREWETSISLGSVRKPTSIPLAYYICYIFIHVDVLFFVIQMSELEVEFKKVKGEKAVPTRYLKSQQQKQAKMTAETAAAGNAEGENITVLVISRVMPLIS